MKRSHAVWLGVFVGLAAAHGGCAQPRRVGTPAEPSGGSHTGHAVASDPLRSVEERAVEPALDCPAGTASRGAAPPEGLRAWCQDPSGREHGPVKRWHASGRLAMTGHYVHGRRHGQWTSFFRNGNKRSEGHYLQGELAGTWQAWYESGELRRRVEFEGNHAQVVAWDRRGTKRREGVYANGRPVGRLREWDEHGNPLEDPQAAEPGTATPDDGSVGIPDCDAVLKAYFDCLEHLPDPAGTQMREALEQMRKQWQETARGPRRDELVQSCRQGHEQLERVLSPLGCVK